MTDREKAIVMAYTGIAMLVGDKIGEFYKYLAELYGRPVYTHELVNLDIASKAKADFIKLCQNEQPETIRCKDCIKREICRTSTTWAITPKDDWYCADAERRTDESD